MATITKDDVSSAWVDLVADLSLTDTKSYILQNVSPYSLELKEKTTLPVAAEFGHVLEPSISWTITVASGTGIYVRSSKRDSNQLGKIALTNTN